MRAMRTARRSLLACLPAALAPGLALAFRAEPATPSIAAEYGAPACAATELHDELRAEIARGFAGQPLPAEVLPRLDALGRCPWCGCGVLGARDHAEDVPPG
jgi:hypothetical protein